MKNMDKKKKSIWRKVAVIAGIVCLLIVTLAAVFLQKASSVEMTSGDKKNGAVETLQNSINSVFVGPIDLGDGLKLTGLAESTGNFPEDGSDEFTENMLSATFINEGQATLQYAEVYVTIDNTVYIFEFSTLPVGKTVRVFEADKKAAPEKASEISATINKLAFFKEEPILHSDELEVEPGNNSITVKNVSGKDITQEISVFFKNTYGDTYMGGITYRVRISGLKAGEEVAGYSSHASAGSSEIMFVTYGN